jgi:hypothetical protein
VHQPVLIVLGSRRSGEAQRQSPCHKQDLREGTCDHTSFALSACQKRDYTSAVRYA